MFSLVVEINSLTKRISFICCWVTTWPVCNDTLLLYGIVGVYVHPHDIHLQVYKVATTEYLLSGKAGYECLEDCEIVVSYI